MTTNDDQRERPQGTAAEGEPREQTTSEGQPADREAGSQAAEQSVPAGAPPRARGAWFALLLALIAIGLAGAVWLDGRRRLEGTTEVLAQRVQALESQQRQLRELAQEAQQSGQSLQGKVATLEVRIADAQGQRAAIEALYKELSRNRNEWRVAEAEQMIDIASQQLELAGNVRGALLALQLAESRLARSDDAAFGPLRAALARDIEKLKALPAFDPGALGQQLERLAVSVEALPLAFDERPAKAPSAGGGVPEQAGESWYRRLGADIWRELRQLVIVRRVDSPEPPLLPPAQSYFLRENLRLRLLSARLALLTRDAQAYRKDLEVAQAWIKRYFDASSKRTTEVLAELEKLAATPIRVELPSIADSVNAVRALDQSSGRGS
jgi:uroporphyrin-3 C-methyltransferase